ncbi:MAG: hypothetical protein R2873_09160 [Caldilineaceae bacterium]
MKAKTVILAIFVMAALVLGACTIPMPMTAGDDMHGEVMEGEMMDDGDAHRRGDDGRGWDDGG